MLARLKAFLQSELGISADVMFVVMGLALFLLTCLIFRKPVWWAWALVPGLCISILIEAMEIRDHYGGFAGLSEQSAKEIAFILLRHSRDILVVNVLPLVVVVGSAVWVRVSSE